jgi:hypothetical protein
MKRVITLLLGLSIALLVNAQENLGIRNSNYAGVQGLFLNPSSMAHSKLKWDVNVIGVGTIFDNNFFYIPKGSLPPFGFKKIIDGIRHENLFANRFDPANPYKQYNITLSSQVIGPSFYTAIAKNKMFGFTIASRAYVNNNDVPGHVAQNAFLDFKDKRLWNTDWQDNTTQFNSMAWLEYGLHYAIVLSDNNKHEWKFGISLNYLQGIGAVYAKNTHLNYNIVDSTKLVVNNSSFDYGLTKYDSGKTIPAYRDLNHGYGLSTNIGFTYILFRDPALCGYRQDGEKWNGDNDCPYKFRIGISLIDIGAINFNRHARAYHFQTDSAVLSVQPNTGNSDLNPTLNSLASQTDSLKVLTADHFNMALPSAISIQADWNVYKNFFLNATVIKGFGHGNNQGIVRPDTYSLTPRYESNWFELSVPMSLIYYHRLQSRIGLAIRVGYFYFGGDAPFSLLGLNDFERTDFYAGVHIFPFEKKKLKEKYYLCPPAGR